MDTEYELSRRLAQLSYDNWLSKDLFSFNRFLMLGIVAVFYAVWMIIPPFSWPPSRWAPSYS